MCSIHFLLHVQSKNHLGAFIFFRAWAKLRVGWRWVGCTGLLSVLTDEMSDRLIDCCDWCALCYHRVPGPLIGLIMPFVQSIDGEILQYRHLCLPKNSKTITAIWFFSHYCKCSCPCGRPRVMWRFRIIAIDKHIVEHRACAHTGTLLNSLSDLSSFSTFCVDSSLF